MKAIADLLKQTHKDELVGEWLNWAGDDAGLGAIWGFGIRFEKNGIGTLLHWGTDIPKEEQEFTFNWKRMNENTIEIGDEETPKEDWETIQYHITDHLGGYSSKYWKITNLYQEEFYDMGQPLFKLRK